MVSDFEKRGDIGDAHLELWGAGAIVLSNSRTLAQRENLLTKEVAQLER